MNKIKLQIAGLSYSQTQSGAYALLLSEVGGKRELPIVIGGFEAQAIAIELEKMQRTRPLTHDLFKNFALAFSIDVREILIYNLSEGVFFSKLICENNGVTTEIDARTSDAIAIAVRFNCPMYTFEHILSSAGIQRDESDENLENPYPMEDDILSPAGDGDLQSLTEDELQGQLGEAIENEDYELASRIRDEMNKRHSN
jgi:bifunctional DNase/RNase